MTVVADASVVSALLMGQGPESDWARSQLAGVRLVAPHLMPVEVVSLMRRAVSAGQFSAHEAVMAAQDLGMLSVEYHEPVPVLERIWELRANVTAYDATYVALAEVLDAPLVTLDRRLARASGPRCAFVTP